MAIFELPDGSIQPEIVSRYKANRRLRQGEPLVRKRRDDGARFLMSLSAGDVLRFPGENGLHHYRVVTSIWAGGQIVLEDHREAQGTVWKRPTVATLAQSGAQKVDVDPIGRVRPARD